MLYVMSLCPSDVEFYSMSHKFIIIQQTFNAANFYVFHFIIFIYSAKMPYNSIISTKSYKIMHCLQVTTVDCGYDIPFLQFYIPYCMCPR